MEWGVGKFVGIRLIAVGRIENWANNGVVRLFCAVFGYFRCK